MLIIYELLLKPQIKNVKISLCPAQCFITMIPCMCYRDNHRCTFSLWQPLDHLPWQKDIYYHYNYTFLNITTKDLLPWQIYMYNNYTFITLATKYLLLWQLYISYHSNLQNNIHVLTRKTYMYMYRYRNHMSLLHVWQLEFISIAIMRYYFCDYTFYSNYTWTCMKFIHLQEKLANKIHRDV